MLSGIGDSKILQENNIPLKHELKQVGKNLIDNGYIIIKYQTQNFSIGQSIPIALINTQSSTTPNTFFVVQLNNNTKQLSFMIVNASPKSPTGFISLYNSNPLMPPKINYEYLTGPQDLEIFINAINYIRQIMSTETIQNYDRVTEISPGLQQTDLSTFIKTALGPTNHFLGTCSMGKTAENSVVDNYFKVHGIHNLRVVDASVFPANFSSKAGPCLTIHALAEKAAYILYKIYS